jgi:hypothetical protein
MSDKINTIQQRLELAGHMPEAFDTGDSAAFRWREDVTTLLAENELLRAALQKIAEGAHGDYVGAGIGWRLGHQAIEHIARTALARHNA